MLNVWLAEAEVRGDVLKQVPGRIAGKRLMVTLKSPGFLCFFLARLQVKSCQIKAATAHSGSQQSARDASSWVECLCDTWDHFWGTHWAAEGTRALGLILWARIVHKMCGGVYMYELKCPSLNLVPRHEKKENLTMSYFRSWYGNIIIIIIIVLILAPDSKLVLTKMQKIK